MISEKILDLLDFGRVKVESAVEEVGVYIPQNMSNNKKMSHVFAMNNLDWKKKTLESSFNATTAMIIEKTDSSNNDQHAKAITISTSTPEQRKTLPSGPSISIPTICIKQKIDRYPGLLVIW